MKTLKGQELREADYAQVLKKIDALLWSLIYKPVVDLVRPTLPKVLRTKLAARDLRDATPRELRNAADDEGIEALRRGLSSGAVQMLGDPTGRSALFAVVKPDRRISDGLKSFGCKLNKTTNLWACPPGAVPAWVRTEARTYAEQAKAGHEQAKRLLDELEGKVDAAVGAADFLPAALHAAGEIEDGWKASAKALEVIPDLGAEGQRALAEGFAAKAKIPIARMAKEMIAELREQVDENATRGYRAEGLAQRIRDQYALSKSRSDLIARQETSNFMSAWQAARAADAGLTKYVWSAAMDARTRPSHRELNGRVFTFKDKAPASYMSFGVPCNPGEDARCRCQARVLLE